MNILSAFKKNLVLAAIIIATVGCDKRTPQEAQQPLKVQFGWLFDAHHLGFLWAQHQGYYSQCASSVELIPGGTESSPAKSVLTRAADLGQFSGPEQLLSSRAEGLPLVAVAAFHRSSPHALISLDRNPIRSASDLQGKTVAVAYGDAAELYLRSLIAKSKLDPKSVKMVPFRFDVTPLIEGEVDAITGFATDQPVTLQEKGQEPVVFRYSDAGIKSYGYLFFARSDLPPEKKESVACFLAASRRGWAEVFKNPEPAVAYLCNERLQGASCSAEAKKLDLIRSIMLSDAGQLDTWAMTADGFRQSQEQLHAFGKISEGVDIQGAFSNALIDSAESR